MQARDVLFIDEIHRLSPAVEEILYPAMEDFQLDLIIGEGPAARSVKIDLAPFTLVGATTRSGMITKPLRDRFGIPLRLEFYKVEDLIEIVTRGARILQLPLTPEAAREIAARSRGTPRIAGRLLRRIRDFAAVAKMAKVDAKAADEALTRLEVDKRGLDDFDRRYMKIIIENYNGGPVGVETLSAALGEPRDALEEIIEPFLLQEGFVQRTPRGRMAAGLAYTHLGLTAAQGDRATNPVRCPARRGRRCLNARTMGRFDGKTHILPVRVYYEDTDVSGIVYHANYLRFMERGRSEFLRLAGIHHMVMLANDEPIAWTIRRIEVDYAKPARLDDDLEIHTRYLAHHRRPHDRKQVGQTRRAGFGDGQTRSRDHHHDRQTPPHPRGRESQTGGVLGLSRTQLTIRSPLALPTSGRERGRG